MGRGLDNLNHQSNKKNLAKGAAKLASKKTIAELPMLDDDEEDDRPILSKKPEAGLQIVRHPRIAVDPKVKKRADEMAASSLLTPVSGLGAKKHTQERRELIIAWLLNGHMYDGRLMAATELADALNVPMETMERDLSTIKQQFSDLYTDPATTDKELPAYAYMLLEMKMQDRGRALTLYNEIAEDIKAMKMGSEICNDAIRDNGPRKKGVVISGRDLAAMRNAQLTALDVASKATSGLDSLFKMLGGPEKVQMIIKAKAVQLNNGNGDNKMGAFSIETLQDTIGNMAEFRSVLPSTRSRDKTEMPSFLDVTPEDEEILEIGRTARGGK